MARFPRDYPEGILITTPKVYRGAPGDRAPHEGTEGLVLDDMGCEAEV
jgi:hypothetical protein